MLNDAEMRHETEITKIDLNDHSFFTVIYIGSLLYSVEPCTLRLFQTFLENIVII